MALTDLQKLALEHVKKMSEECDSKIIRLCNTDKINDEKDIYPAAGLARGIGHWIDAIKKEG